jgi:uncharacterized heparinase superfamily protein
LNSIQLYWDTARHLKPIQFWSRVWRPRPRIQFVEATERPREGKWSTPIKRISPWLGGRRWRHLNQEREIRTWNDDGVDKLWLYHLHYLDHPCAEIVNCWMEENPPGKGNGWEPYPLSKRISNLIVWLLGDSVQAELRAGIEKNLAVQVEWLSRRVEWHLLGNHLLANAKALVMGGAYFAGDSADRWLREGAEILRRELSEQVLEDGGHFELSPMYHALILEDLLDLINLARVYPRALAQEEKGWRRTASRMLGWLAQLTHPNGQLAYFNDSVQGVAAEATALKKYAARLGLEEQRMPLGASGYARLEAGDTVVLFDLGPVGPDYQPGHGHCDLLSLEVSHKGRPVITNSGVSTYEAGPRRLAERRTAAHNTVRIDQVDQSEVWGSFRVARRANVLDSKTNGSSWAEAAHDGYRRLNGNVTHRRRVDVKRGSVTIIDRIEGSGVHSAEIYWHPAIGAVVEVEFDAILNRREENGWWSEGFNRRMERTSIIGIWSGTLPVELVTRLRFG